MSSLSQEITLENNILELDNSLKKVDTNLADQLSNFEKKELIESSQRFGISPVKETALGQKFVVHYDQNQNLVVYPFQSKEKLKDELSTLALTSKDKKDYLALISEGGIKYLTIDNKKLMYHPGLNTLINVGLTQPKLRIVKVSFITKTFTKLLNRILKKETKDKYEIDYDTSREDFLDKIAGQKEDKPKETIIINKDNDKQVEQFINDNPSYLLDINNPPIALSIHQFVNLSEKEQTQFKSQNPNMIKTLDFFLGHELNKNLNVSDIEKILKGETSSIVNLKVKNQSLTGKIKINQNTKGEIKAVFHKQKTEPIQENEVFKKLRSEDKKNHLLDGGVLPIQTTNGSLRFYQYDKDLNDVLEVNLHNLNIPKQLFESKSNNQIINMFMGKPEKADLEIDGIQIPNVDIVINKGKIQIGGEEDGLVKEKVTELEKSKQEIIDEIVNDNSKNLDEKIKLATEKKVGIKEVLEAVQKTESKPKKIKMVSDKILNETKKALQITLFESSNLNEYLKRVSEDKNISVWVAFDENNESISGVSYKVDKEIILGKDSKVGLKELVDKFGAESIKQKNIDKSFLINRVEDKEKKKLNKSEIKM
jgi:hypothetical protein